VTLTHRAACLAAVLTISVLTGGRAALACSVCLAGDPLYNIYGASVQQQGSFSAYFQARGWFKRSGHPPGEHAEEHEEGHAEEHEEGHAEEHEEGHAEEHEEGHAEEHAENETEENESQRLDLYLSWAPLDRVTLTLDIPWAFNNITEVSGDKQTSLSLDGLGDIMLAGSVVAWRSREILAQTWVAVNVFGKFPSGKSKAAAQGGAVEKHLQPGTGSWDFGGGFSGAHHFSWGSLYGSTSYRVNTKGSLDYEYGDVALANAVVDFPLGHGTGIKALAPFTPTLAVNFRWSEKDLSQGEKFQDSGGSILYLTPGLRIRLPWFEGRRPPSLQGEVQIPVTSSWLHGFQEEGNVWFAGLYYPF